MDAGSVNTAAVPTEYDNSSDTDLVPLTEYESFMRMAAISGKKHLDSSKTVTLSTNTCDSYECVVCAETKPNTEIWHSPCEEKHLTCYDCVRKCYLIAIKKLEPNFASCCGIPFWDENVRKKILGKDLTEEWLDCLKAVDNINQVYCSTFNCWRPLNEHAHGSNDTAVLTCPKCCLGTCSWCLEPAHPGVECTLEEGEWPQRCFRCGRFAEHEGGCWSMLCECGVSFCYRCGFSLAICESTHCGLKIQ